MLVTQLHFGRNVAQISVTSTILKVYCRCHTFLGRLPLIATRICHSECHSDVTLAHCVVPLGAAHRPCAIVTPTSPRARPSKSSCASHLNPSLQRVGTLQRALPAALYAIVHSNQCTGRKKRESLFASCVYNSNGNTNSLPTPNCRKHPLISREATNAPKP